MYGQQAMAADRPYQTAAASVGYSEEPRPVPELPAALERAQQAMESVMHQIESLDNRLSGVVARPVGPVSEGKSANALKCAMNTGVGAQLDALNERLLLAHVRLSGLLERLEF